MNFFQQTALLTLCAVVFVITSAASSFGHPMGFGSAELTLSPDGFSGELVLDSPPEYSEEKQPDVSTAERSRQLSEQIKAGFVLKFDDQPSKTNVKVLALGTGPTAIDVVRVWGDVPKTPKAVTLRTSNDMGDLGIEVGGPLLAEPLRGLVQKDTESPKLLLGPNPGKQAWKTVGSDSPEPSVSARKLASQSGEAQDALRPAPKPERYAFSFWEYLTLGFRHIVPHGADHVLFVLGLLLSHTLLAGRWLWLRGLALQLSVFTLAHSVTLALGALGAVSVNASLIEPLIALSIVYVGVEPLLFGVWLVRPSTVLKPKTQRLALWRRSSVVFAFGLLHGLGFASALSTKGLDGGALFSSLFAFNLGVEGGQLFVAATAAALLFGLRERPFYKRWVLTPACGLISVVGLFWFIERIS